MTTRLTPENVTLIFTDCLFSDEEMKEIGEQHFTSEEVLRMKDPPFIAVEGIVHNVALHPGRVAKHRDSIREMLSELPPEFHETGGGGMSFLNMCMRADGEQWTGLHQTQEQLCFLGIAADLGAWVLPKHLWPVLPGGMPYYVVKDSKNVI